MGAQAKGILFNTNMVRAILNGRKTVTRRVIKIPPENFKEYRSCWIDGAFIENGKLYYEIQTRVDDSKINEIKPRYQPGDILYVRETWNYGYFDSSDMEGDNSCWFEEFHKADGKYLKEISHYIYRADFTEREEYEFGTEDENGKRIKIPWKPSVHMPKEAARIWLKVTDVRVERLQDMRFEDCLAEGAFVYLSADGLFNRDVVEPEAKQKFAHLWNSTIKKKDLPLYGWDANPRVWAIEFERCEKPED